MPLVHTIVDSDEYVRPLLREAFRKDAHGLSQAELLAFLASTIWPHSDGEARVVSIVGGAGGGKSTLARRLIACLQAQGLAAETISTDDYVLGDRTWRWQHFEGELVRDPRGKYDFAHLHHKINAIRKNRSAEHFIKVPTYDAASGRAIDVGEENYRRAIGKLDVLVVEGDVEIGAPDLTIYLHLADRHRLQNRIARDQVERGVPDPKRIAANFALRQRNQHFPYTLPAISKADIVVHAQPHGEWRYDTYRAK
ncbi:MAG TPA: hypothetical protein VLG11_00165 [Candidatus Saccharimonadales bacterium]|nr:hypothetical protein [Candidatus Saccharimonadales bacterium]